MTPSSAAHYKHLVLSDGALRLARTSRAPFDVLELSAGYMVRQPLAAAGNPLAGCATTAASPTSSTPNGSSPWAGPKDSYETGVSGAPESDADRGRVTEAQRRPSSSPAAPLLA